MAGLPTPPALPYHPSHTPTASTSTSSSSRQPIHDNLARDFPDVSTLPQEDLQLLLEDPAYFDAYFHSQLPQAKLLQEQVEQATRDNIALAEKSEAMKPALDALREDTARLFNEANELKERWAWLDEAQKEAYKRFSQSAQLSRYRAATTLQERLSDSLVSSFLTGGEGGFDEESFVKQYREVRKVYHKREIGLRKWEEGRVVWM
ncbi:hypothetical protein JCM8547_000761 [Rhodosporidiobolus lusitaniae]